MDDWEDFCDHAEMSINADSIEYIDGLEAEHERMTKQERDSGYFEIFQEAIKNNSGIIITKSPYGNGCHKKIIANYEKGNEYYDKI